MVSCGLKKVISGFQKFTDKLSEIVVALNSMLSLDKPVLKIKPHHKARNYFSSACL